MKFTRIWNKDQKSFVLLPVISFGKGFNGTGIWLAWLIWMVEFKIAEYKPAGLSPQSENSPTIDGSKC